MAAAAGATLAMTAPAARAVATTATSEPFWGAHQSGITTPQQAQLYFAALDVTATQRTQLIDMLQRWTLAAARLAKGETAVPLGSDLEAAPADSGESVGLAPSRLTITFGFGPGLFTQSGVDRFGLAAKRPPALIDLPKFNGDQLIAERSGGDLSIQACADDPQVAFHALRQLISMADGVATLRWMQSGFVSGDRNLMGFKDGTNNPSVKDLSLMNTHVWVGAEGGWMQGGSYQVVRRIRIALEHWDKTKLGFQEEVVGRHKMSGAPLGGKHAHEPLNLTATDADGNLVIPETAHARIASPQQNDGAQMLRRGYSYNDGASFYSERWPPWRQGILYDAGLFFAAYQRDPRTSFVRVQQALSMQDMMNQYTTHVGSGIFACPPGAATGSYIGASLFET
jgi:deferrochelatase/peroxidase EfeB